MKISITIPAYNEAGRIGRTLQEYGAFFGTYKKAGSFDFELLVVPNGCKDNTVEVVCEAQKTCPEIRIIDLKQAGKGLAITAGFHDALSRDNDLIGFLDADMATRPQYYYDLMSSIGDADGIIASRYMKESKIFPTRPFINEWGRVLVYNPITRLLFWMPYIDFQCGAKLFKRHVIEKIAPQLTVKQWAFDVELLYLCKRHDFKIKEVPTVWYDQDDSKFNLRGGLRMLGSLFKLRLQHSPLGRLWGKNNKCS